jgi:TonB-linked SusC/RagA family outer membrane protein
MLHRYFKNYGMVKQASVLLTLLGCSSTLVIAQDTSRMPVASETVQSKKKVTGTVTDNAGKPLEGVTITLKGTTTKVVTAANGTYTINVPAGKPAELEFSYVGLPDKTVSVAAGSTVGNIQFQEDTNNLNDIVVVGYGKRKKETLTGSVTSVSAKTFQDKGSLASPLQAMQGQVPGVIITRSSSAPGDEAWSMKIRGAVSANATAEPLVIIDGVAADSFRELRLLNTSDIENISILKDGAAAIYGSRAAGGVVLVTTKRAKKGKSVVEYGASFTRKKVGLQPRLMDISEWANGVIRARKNDNYGADDVWIRYAQLALANAGGYIDLANNPNPITGAFTDVKDYVFLNNNWSDVLWGGANSTQQDLSISGRGEKSGYRLSLGYLNDGGVLQYGNNNNKRYNIRLVNDFQVSDRFTIESVVAYSRNKQVMPTMISNVINQGYPQPGLPAATLNGKPYAWGGQYTPNWFAELGGDNKLNVAALNISETFKYKITKGLELNANLGYNSNTAGRDQQQNSIQWYNYTGTALVQTNPTQPNSFFQKTTARTDFYSAAAFLQYTKNIGGVHNIGANIGTQYERNEYDYYLVRVSDINSSLPVLSGSGTVVIRDPSNANNKTQRNHYAMGSYFGRVNYDYKSKYLAEVLGRYDGSSKFGPANRWNFFYGVSAGWRISQEAFAKEHLRFFNELKLRGSYGIVGNQTGIDLYDGEQLYNVVAGTGAYLGNGKVTYVTTNGKLVSYNRTWEKIHNYNIAIDFAALHNKLSGTVEWFLKKNVNMLLEQAYSVTLGAAAPLANIGRFRGSGWEGSLNWSDKVGAFQYRVGGTFTYAANKIVDFGGKNLVTAAGFKDKVGGFPLNSIFGYRYAGRMQTQQQRDEYYNKYVVGNTIGLTSAVRVGDNMYEDVSGPKGKPDGLLTIDDLVYLGSDDPRVSYSFNAGFDWKGIDFTAIFQGAAQRTTFRDDVNWRIPFRSVYLNTTNQSVGDNWTPENPGAHFPKYSTNSDINNYNYQASTWSVENGAYLRLKNIVLGYTLPASLLAKTKAISKLRVYVSGTDLWEHSSINDGWDPEATRQVSGTQRYPFNRFYTVGLNVTF